MKREEGRVLCQKPARLPPKVQRGLIHRAGAGHIHVENRCNVNVAAGGDVVTKERIHADARLLTRTRAPVVSREPTAKVVRFADVDPRSLRESSPP